MSQDFFNIEDILNNDRNRSKSGRNNGPSFNNLSRNNFKNTRQDNPEKRTYPNFDLGKSKTKEFNADRSYNNKFNNYDLEELKNNNFNFDRSRNRNNSRNVDVYYMDQDASSEFISAIDDNKKQFYDPKPRKGRKLYGDDLYSSQELEKAPELVKVTPITEEKSKTKKNIASRRSSFLIFAVVVIFIFFITLIFLLLNQSRVMEVSYENAAIKSQIAHLEKDNAERIERLAREADLNDIAKKASSFGFQIPNRQQKVEVKDDKLDQVIYFDENNNAIGIVSSEVDMDLVFNNIENYIIEKEKSSANSVNQGKKDETEEMTESDSSEQNIESNAENKTEGENNE